MEGSSGRYRSGHGCGCSGRAGGWNPVLRSAVPSMEVAKYMAPRVCGRRAAGPGPWK